MPANLLQLQSGKKSFGSRILFEDATFAINEDEHIGLIGPNGAGKTTLFKLLAGELELDSGEVVRSRDLRLGYLKQHDTWDETQSVETFLSKDALTPIWELKKLGRSLGLDESRFDAPISALSGGYKMRVKLLHLIGQQPNLMFLDEPTNYLDLETLLVLENFLQDYQGAFLLISHDREFLRRTTDHILEIESGEFVKYNGNIDDFFEQKTLLREQLEKAAMGQAQKQKQIMDFVTRFGAKATKARQAQSRLKQLQKMEKIELKRLPVKASIQIPEPSHTGRLALELKDVDLGYGEKVVLSGLDLKIETGDRIGVVGLNGAGKSTLLKSLAKEIPSLHGELTYGYQVRASYYGQHVAERLDPEDSVISSLNKVAHRDIRPQEILNLAGSLLFSGDDTKKKIHVLSGGEKARVSLGQVLLQKAPLLLLDEPTNHLDFYTVEALTQALENYAGTIILVSHDRGFIGRVATKILEVNAGQVSLYPGSYEDYVWSIQQRQLRGELNDNEPVSPKIRKLRKLPEVETSQDVKTPAPPQKPTQQKENLKTLQSEKKLKQKLLSEIERKMKSLQNRIAQLSAELSQNPKEKAGDLSRDLGLTQKKLDELEADYFRQLEEVEVLTSGIQNLKKN